MYNFLYSTKFTHNSIFKKGSKTYFYSSLLFPKKVRADISHLYSFVRTIDDFVDSTPQKIEEFKNFTGLFFSALKSRKQTESFVINDFINLLVKKRIKKEIVDAFIHSMDLDTKKNSYKNFEELDEYLYGSAEVIGLMIAKIIDLDSKSYPYAKKFGKAMQYINFIRDIAEDNELNRIYIPQSELKKYNFKNLNYQTAITNPNGFRQLIRAQIEVYSNWQKEAETGFKYISPKYLTAIKTASDLYKWTAVQIYKDPFIVYSRKVKPPMHTIITHAGQNVFKQYLWT